MFEGGGSKKAPEPEAASAHGLRGPRDVFVSYASQDSAVADALCASLERSDVACWIAPRDVTPGALYADAIIRAITSAKILVVVLSEHAVASSHVGKEVERASSKGRAIIGLRIDAAPLTPALEYFLSESQWIDLGTDGADAAFAKLVDAVQLHLAVASASGHSPTKPERHAVDRKSDSRQRSWIIVALVFVFAVPLAYVAADKFGLSRRAAAERSAMPEAPVATAKSVAVLPFVDMSEKKDQEYFSDGLSEELIDMLTKVPELRVPARTSSFYFKGKQTRIGDIAKALGVANVLEGSVRKSGNTLRITAQLIRVDNGYHVWSQTFDRPLDDIFKVQDEIAGAVVQAMKVSLLEAAAPRSVPTANSEAYTLYLEALSLAQRGASADSLRAHAYLQRALHLDPTFALAWAALAELYTDDTVVWGEVFAPAATPAQRSDALSADFAAISRKVAAAARDAGAHALTLGPNLADAHRAMARVQWWIEWNWAAADAELKKARALDPGSARITQLAAGLAITMGRLAEGLELAKLAAAQDPLGTVYWDIGAASYRLGLLEPAAAAFRRLIELYPTAAGAHFRYALVLLSQHEPQAALDQMERDDPEYRHAGFPLGLDALGRRSEADRELAIAERDWADGMAYQISYVYAARNERGRALYWLERAYRQHDDGLLSIKHDPMLKSLEQDPHYHALLRKMKLPD